jgi:light-independent protochlorophyllide reductase subunit B
VEVRGLLERLGIAVNVVAPLGASPADIGRLALADFNIVLYPEIAGPAAAWLERTYGQRSVRTLPIGVGATRDFILEVAAAAGVDPAPALDPVNARAPWWSRSVDSTYLTGKRVFIFGDASHAVAAARVASQELGFEVVGLGCYNREFAREVRAAAAEYGLTALITEDYLEVERAIAELQPELVLGTQMERHIAKRLHIACAVISAPAHVQDYPARHSPQMGYEGANVLFDTWVHPLVMGLEEHLLAMFRDDFEFNDAAGPSHLGAGAHALPAHALPAHALPAHAPSGQAGPAQGSELAAAAPLGADAGSAAAELSVAAAPGLVWTNEAQAELSKIPFFVRGKARRNTEAFAASRGIDLIHIETLYDARSHFSR